MDGADAMAVCTEGGVSISRFRVCLCTWSLEGDKPPWRVDPREAAKAPTAPLEPFVTLTFARTEGASRRL